MYNLQKQDVMKRSAEDTQLYQLIHIDGGKLRDYPIRFHIV